MLHTVSQMKVHKPRRWTRWQPSGEVVRLLEREYDCDDTLDARRRTLLHICATAPNGKCAYGFKTSGNEPLLR